MLDFIKNNLMALALAILLLVAAGFSLYLWGYHRGYDRCDAEHAATSLLAVQTNATANQNALAMELQATALRTESHTKLHQEIEVHNAPDDDKSAPAIDQLFYDRLRAAHSRR